MRVFIAAMVILLCVPFTTSAIVGYDYSSEEEVYFNDCMELEEDSLVAMYDYADGTEHEVMIDTISVSGTSVDVEVFDVSDHEFRVLEIEMDSDSYMSRPVR